MRTKVTATAVALLAVALLVTAAVVAARGGTGGSTSEAGGSATGASGRGSVPAAATVGATGSASRAAEDASPYAGSYELENETTGTEVSVTVEDGVRRITANGLPDHGAGEFPNEGNPNSISAQSYDYELPEEPTVGSPETYNVPQPFGIAHNGVIIDPFAAEWYQGDRSSGWQLAALASPLGFDENDAHVQPNGAYHYHGASMALLTTEPEPELIGWAADGFPIYGPYGYADPDDPDSGVEELTSSYQVKSGERPDGPGGEYDGTYVEDYEYVEGSGDLDECNGRTGVTPEHPDGTYHYVATNDWPYFGRCFVGEVAESWAAEGPQRVGPPGPGAGAPPQQPQGPPGPPAPPPGPPGV